jgi:hypothetical protein
MVTAAISSALQSLLLSENHQTALPYLERLDGRRNGSDLQYNDSYSGSSSSHEMPHDDVCPESARASFLVRE